MRRVAVALIVAVAALPAEAPAAGAQAFGAAIVGSPALGVAADGQAVLAWSGSVTIFASVRPASGVFGVRQRLSTGGNAARSLALGVGRRGDAVVVWQRSDRSGRATGPLYASVRRPFGGFHAAVRVPGSDGGRAPAAALAPDGTLLVAWLRAAARGCGAAVLASVARPGRPFGAARRISGRCPNAAALRAAMARDGTGAVVWRAGRAIDAYALDAASVGRTRFGIVRRVSHSPVVGFGAEVTGAATGALVVWRDRASGSPQGAIGRVLSADVTVHGTTEIRPVSAGDRVVGVPRVTARPDGSALVAWEEGLYPPRVLAAESAGPTAPFAPPAVVDTCGAIDASRTYASPALDGRRSPAVAFQSACMGRFGLGTDYGIAFARRPPSATWQPASALSHGTYSVGSRVGAADDGELVTAWVETGAGGGLQATVLAP